MKISIVIPAYNEEKLIAQCIESCLRHKTDSLLEIVVVDNASTDRTAEIAARYPMVTVVRESRKGLGYARQKGFETMRGDVYASVDADSRIGAEWLPTIERELGADPSLLCLSGPYRFYDLPEWQDRLAFLWWTTLAQHQKAAVVGGNFAARSSALDAIGGFNTDIAFWSEDAYIARRLSEIGRIKFSVDFVNYSSARRLQGQGFVTVGTYYALNYLSQMYRNKPFMTGHGERPWEDPETRKQLAYAGIPATVAKATRYVKSYVRPPRGKR